VILLEDVLTNNLDIVRKYSRIYLLENLENKKKYLLSKLQDYDNPEEVLDWIAKTDPVAVKSKNKKTPFVNQILIWFLNDKIRLPEDINTTKEALILYNKAKQSGSVKPITDYQSPGEIRQDFDETDIEATDDQYNVAELVDQHNGFKMYKIDNWDQGKICFADSGWCVKDQEWFSQYNPPFYMITRGNKRYALLHKDTYQAKDVYDDTLTLEKARPIKELIFMVWPVEDYKFEDDLRHLVKLYPKEVLETIKKDAESAYLYSINIIKDRWPEAEPHIMKDPWFAYLYARFIIKGRWPEAEPYIMKDAESAYLYAICIIKGRWPEA